MEKKEAISVLIEKCTSYFEQNRYTKGRVERYKSMWRNGICLYMHDKGIKNFNPTIGRRFIKETISSKVTPAERDIVRSISVLIEMLETGKVSKRMCHPVQREPVGIIGEAIKDFLSWLKEMRRSQTTIKDHLLYLYRFNQYLENNKVKRFEEINQRHILSFVSTKTNNKINVVSSLRMFFRFVYDRGLAEKEWASVLKNYKWIKHEKLPSIYTAEEVKLIESSVSRTSVVGKRDYAALLLATRLGLRASDIAHLAFANLDWVRSRIILRQFKTGKEIELPLLAEVGEAIIDYLKFGRQNSIDKEVFLSARAPYRPMTGDAVSSAIRRIIETSDVCIGKRKLGPHAMRHSLAGRLLENKVSLPVISESLGHQKTETTMTYLRIDIKALRKFALEVPAVDPSFYSQRGGIFHA